MQFMEQQVRWLLAWMNEIEATLALLGRERAPREDIAMPRRIWQEAMAALMRRPPYRRSTPVLSKLPGSLKDRAASFQRRPDVIAALHVLDWKLGIVDLRDVLSYQWNVADLEALKGAEAVDPKDPDTLFSFCLPEPGNQMNAAARIDPDRMGITLSSRDPNLRIGAPAITDVDLSRAPGGRGKEERFVGFPVHFGSPFIKVAEYNGRWLLCDGYHRSYALLKRSIHKIPCVFIRARNLAETGAERPAFVPREMLYGDRPPFVADFLDDSVTITVNRKANLKLARVIAAEFVVEVL
ncbi:MAG: hypothetical protein WBC78_00750 [Candidatus Sulfotelmatobacter sp.]